MTHGELEAADPASYQALRRGDYDHVTGAEPTVEVAKRMGEALRELLAALEPGTTGIAVSHGAAVRVAVGELLGWPDELFRTLGGLENCAWAVVLEHPVSGALLLEAYSRTA